MLNKEYYIDSHLTNKAFDALLKNKLSQEEKILILSHIDYCDECMEHFVNVAESNIDESKETKELEQKIMFLVKVQSEQKKEKKVLVVQFVKLAVAVSIMFTIFFSGSLSMISDKDVSVNRDEKSNRILFMLNSEIEQKDNNQKENSFITFTDNLKRKFYDFSDMINYGFKGDAENDAE